MLLGDTVMGERGETGASGFGINDAVVLFFCIGQDGSIVGWILAALGDELICQSKSFLYL